MHNFVTGLIEIWLSDGTPLLITLIAPIFVEGSERRRRPLSGCKFSLFHVVTRLQRRGEEPEYVLPIVKLTAQLIGPLK